MRVSVVARFLAPGYRRNMLRASAPLVTDPDVETDVVNERKIDRSGPRIRCPLCAWQPGKQRPLVV